jgi:hypothetical protein
VGNGFYTLVCMYIVMMGREVDMEIHLHTRGIQYELEEDRRTLGYTRSVEVSTMNVEDAGSITIPMPTFYALACKT